MDVLDQSTPGKRDAKSEIRPLRSDLLLSLTPLPLPQHQHSDNSRHKRATMLVRQECCAVDRAPDTLHIHDSLPEDEQQRYESRIRIAFLQIHHPRTSTIMACTQILGCVKSFCFKAVVKYASSPNTKILTAQRAQYPGAARIAPHLFRQA